MPTRLLFTLVAGVFAYAATANAQPTLTSTSPGAVAPGKTIDLTLNGTKFDETLTIWASFPAKLELAPLNDPKKVSATSRVCRVTLDANTPIGIGGLIVATKDGYSDPLLLMIDDLPSLADAGGNLTFEKPQDVSLPAAIDGAGNAGSSDFYRFQVQAGQRVAMEVVASRMSVDFDPVVRLLDATGKVLVLADDDLAIGSDCRFSYVFQNAGQYVVEIRDNQYRANGRYRLRLGDFPLLTAAYPLGGVGGTVTKFAFFGPDVGNVAPMDVAPPANVVGGRWSISAKLPGGVASGMTTIATSSLSESVEVEPNNELAKATPIKVPGGVNGRFESEKDRDFYQFSAKKGQRFVFRACGRSYGSPVFLKMFLQKADGKPLAESPVSDADEESFTYEFTEDGNFALVVEDLLKRGGADFVYRVAVEPAAGFSMNMKPDKKAKTKYTTPKNGALAFDVPVARNGYDGPITLTLEGNHPGFQVFNNVVAEKQATAKLLIVPPANATPGDFAALRIVGHASVGGNKVSATLTTADQIRLVKPAFSYPPAWLDGLIGLSVGAEIKPHYSATLDRSAIQVSGSGGPAEFAIAMERLDKEFKDPLTVSLANLPPGATYEVKREGNGPKEKYLVSLKLPKDMPFGRTVFKVVTYGELKGQGQAIMTEVPLEVIAPLTVSLAPTGGIVFGNKQKVRITVVRPAGADKQTISLKWKNLPAGVTGSENLTIAADKEFIEAELTATPNAVATKIDNLSVAATTKFQGADVTVESAPLGLEIQK